jgi:hypothetical protein
MNCFDAVSRDRNGGSVKRPPSGVEKDQDIFLSDCAREGFLSSLEKSHTSSWNPEITDTSGFSPPEPTNCNRAGDLSLERTA